MADALVEWLQAHLPRYLEELRFLVGLDSGSYYKAGVDAVVDWLDMRMRALGMEVQRQPQEVFGDNLLATLPGNGSGRILLLGHSDTVFPVGTAAARPMQIRGDHILGPGVCDMKAGLLSGLYAVESLLATGPAGWGTLSFLCVSDEEVSGRPSLPLIRSAARRADAVLVLEAARANGDIVTARKALRWYQVRAWGRAAHSGVEPEKGHNAILPLARAAVEIDRLNGLFPGVTVNIGVFEGGMAPNVVPPSACLRLEVRSPHNEGMETLAAALRAAVERQQSPGVRLELALEGGTISPALERTPAVEGLERLAQEAARQLGFSVSGASTGGVSDANHVAGECPAVLDGLGPIGGLDHGPDEYIVLSSIVPRTALLARLISAISQKGVP